MAAAPVKIRANIPTPVVCYVGVAVLEERLLAFNAGFLTATLLLALAFASIAAVAAAAAAAPAARVVCSRGSEARKFRPVFALRLRCKVHVTPRCNRSVSSHKCVDREFIDNEVCIIDKILAPPSFLRVTFRVVGRREPPNVIEWHFGVVIGAWARRGCGEVELQASLHPVKFSAEDAGDLLMPKAINTLP